MFVHTIQPVVKPVVKPVWQAVVSCKRGIDDGFSHEVIGLCGCRLELVWESLFVASFTPVDNMWASNDDCPEDKREDYQNCSVIVLCATVVQVIRTHIRAVLKVDTIRYYKLHFRASKSWGVAILVCRKEPEKAESLTKKAFSLICYRFYIPWTKIIIKKTRCWEETVDLDFL